MIISLFSVFPLAIFSSLAKANHADTPSHSAHHHHLAEQARQADNPGEIALTWLAGWHIEGSNPTFTPDNISWEKYTDIAYSFATPTEDVTRLSLDGSGNEESLKAFVLKAHEKEVNAIIALGGWAGSRFFSSAVGSEDNRTAFVKTVTDFTTSYQLDGINFDWESPNKQGIGCNVVSADDTQNFLVFLKELRQHPVGAKLKLSAATGITPFLDSKGTPLSDVSDFNNLFDYITIMNYDIWGSWSSSVGPNSPLDDSCASEQNRQGSAVSAVESWTKAGMEPQKIVLGVASYGHSFLVEPKDAFKPGSNTELASYPAFDASAYPHGDSWDTDGGLDVCGHNEPNGGNFDFWGLIKQGWLDESGEFTATVPHRFDSCSQTPYTYDPASKIMVSFDNAQSFAAKGKFIKEKGLAGFAMWEAGGDSNDILLDAISAECRQ